MPPLSEKYKLHIRFFQKIVLNNNILIDPDSCGQVLYFETSNSKELSLTVTPWEDNYITEIRAEYECMIGRKRFEAFNNYQSQGKPIQLHHECPDTIKAFLNEHIKTWRNEGRRLITLFRWRMDSTLDLRGLEEDVQFSLNGSTWQKIYYIMPWIGGIRLMYGLSYNPRNDVQALLDKDLREPLPHDLINEAHSLFFSSPRSALILSVVALEVGLKELLVKLRPELQWPQGDSQAPPVEIILKDYLPDILAESNIDIHWRYAERISNQTLETIKNVVKDRNDLIHQGKYSLTNDQLHHRIDVISDLLHLFDFLLGQIWAIRHTRSNRTYPE